MRVCTPRGGLGPSEVRRQCWIPWNWSFRGWWATVWVLELNPGPLQKQQVLLLSEPSLQYSAITSLTASQHDQIGDHHISSPKPLRYRSKPQCLVSQDPELDSEVTWCNLNLRGIHTQRRSSESGLSFSWLASLFWSYRRLEGPCVVLGECESSVSPGCYFVTILGHSITGVLIFVPLPQFLPDISL